MKKDSDLTLEQLMKDPSLKGLRRIAAATVKPIMSAPLDYAGIGRKLFKTVTDESGSYAMPEWTVFE